MSSFVCNESCIASILQAGSAEGTNITSALYSLLGVVVTGVVTVIAAYLRANMQRYKLSKDQFVAWQKTKEEELSNRRAATEILRRNSMSPPHAAFAGNSSSSGSDKSDNTHHPDN